MRFWDSSAVVPLLVAQAHIEAVQRLMNQDPEVVLWWATPVECASALARLGHEGGMTAAEANVALARLRELMRSFDEAQPTERVRRGAQRLLRCHRMRAADALQLAAAIEANLGRPPELPFVCFDEPLADAARREGFDVLPHDR